MVDTALMPNAKHAPQAFESSGYGRQTCRPEELLPRLGSLYYLTRDRWHTMTPEQTRVIWDWARDGCRKISEILHADGVIDWSQARYAEHVMDQRMRLWQIMNLDQCMVELSEPMTVYRGCDYPKQFDEGRWTNPGFTCTTWDLVVARRFAKGHKGTRHEEPRERRTLVHIELPAGTPVLAVGATPVSFRREGEVLLARGTSFEITQASDVRGTHVVHARALP